MWFLFWTVLYLLVAVFHFKVVGGWMLKQYPEYWDMGDVVFLTLMSILWPMSFIGAISAHSDVIFDGDSGKKRKIVSKTQRWIQK